MNQDFKSEQKKRKKYKVKRGRFTTSSRMCGYEKKTFLQIDAK